MVKDVSAGNLGPGSSYLVGHSFCPPKIISNLAYLIFFDLGNITFSIFYFDIMIVGYQVFFFVKTPQKSIFLTP